MSFITGGPGDTDSVQNFGDWNRLVTLAERGDPYAQQLVKNYMAYWETQARHRSGMNVPPAPLYFNPGTAATRPGRQMALRQPENTAIAWEQFLGMLRADLSSGKEIRLDGRKVLPPAEKPEVIRVSPDPPKRIGREVRDRYLDHLQEMCAGEFITEQEYETRSGKALTAKTKGELDVLVRDLPDLPAAKPPVISSQPAIVRQADHSLRDMCFAFTFMAIFIAGTIIAGVHLLPMLVSLLFAVYWGVMAFYSVTKRKRS